MLVAKTLKCKVFQPTKLKYSLLNQEYENLQKFLRGNKEVKLYSANKQQALRFYKEIKPNKEYPLSIRKDLIKIKETNHKLAKYWVRLPIAGRRGGIWLPIRTYTNFDGIICESKVYKKDNDFFINITFKKKVEIKSYSSIISVDLGEKVIATVLLNGKPIFLGKEIRGIRRKYAYIRKRLGEKKLLKEIKHIANKEKRIVNDCLHKISSYIVGLATSTNSSIVVGNLKGIRASAKGKRMNRIVSNMPYYKLTKYIEYKANWKGIRVFKIGEKGTSHICPKCYSKGTRPYQGLFVCKNCGYQANADYVGAQNIKKRFEEYISSNGVVSEPALNLTIMKINQELVRKLLS